MPKRTLLLLSILALLCAGPLCRARIDERQSGKRLIDIKAGIMYPIKVADSSAVCLTGEVVFYHNGAVITCDSAVRYSDKHMECFRNVIINKDSTYIYGDRVDYNGELNIATVYSPLIKIVDGDAVMYTYNFRFNTLDNIGEFYGGGVLYQGDNVMESDRGYYFSSSRQVSCVQNVEMRNSEYQMRSDSMTYDMDSSRAEFFTRSYMWNIHGDMLSADRGKYDRNTSMCYFTSQAYVLSSHREMWCDTLEYDNYGRNAEARSNVQILEDEHKSMAFSDFARYMGQRGETYLTRRPSMLNFDPEQNGGDTIFMRADTIYMFVLYPSDVVDSLAFDVGDVVDRMAHLRWVDTLDTARRVVLADSVRTEYQAMMHVSDSLSAAADSVMSAASDSLRPAADSAAVSPQTDYAVPPDSLVADSATVIEPGGLAADSLSAAAAVQDSLPPLPQIPDTDALMPPEVKQWRHTADSLRHIADSLRMVESYIRPAQSLQPEIVPEGADSLLAAGADTLPRDSVVLTPKQLKKLAKEQRREQKAEARRLKREQKQERLRQRLARRGIEYGPPEGPDSPAADTLPPILSDSLLNAVPPPVQAETEDADTVSRIIRGWHNVRMFRKDMQAVADSLVAFSADTTMHLYISPVIWSGENQITSEVVDMFTASQALDRAEFSGNPIMSSKLDTVHYNQVAGKTMTARFRNGELVRNDVNGNAQAIYYLQEDDDPAILALLVVTCSNMTFEFEDQFVSYITPRVSLEWHMYPMDKIPDDQPLILSWFEWVADRRPQRADVFDRTQILPSQRAEYEAVRKPRFAISKKVDARRKRLVEGGKWADRTDPLPQHAVDYIRNIAPPQQH